MSDNVSKVQNVQFTSNEIIRWDLWTHAKERGLTDEAFAATIQLKTTKQIQRLKSKAKQNGAYRDWVNSFIDNTHEEFWQLHKIVKDINPELAYTTTGHLIERQLTQKTEQLSMNLNKTEVTLDVADLLKQYEDLFEEATILENCAPKPLHPPPPNSKTSTIPTP